MGEEPERLRADVHELARVLRSGMTGVYSWNGVKTMVGRKLDALDALLAEVERLAEERDALEERLETRLEDDAVYRVYDEKVAECERLAGRVAELMDTLEIIETSPTVEDANRVARSARSEVLRADVGGSE